KLKYKRTEGAAVGPNIQTATKKRRKEHPYPTGTQRNMQLPSFPFLGLLLLLNLQFVSAYPIRPGLTENEMDTLKVLLHRLAESVSEQTEVDQKVPDEERLDDLKVAEAADGDQSQTGLDEAAIREFLSAKNLRSVRNDSTRRSSSCFGRRMDRIGSMSSLGCNTIGKYSPKRR
ncbi:hypothetical protein LDENG_00015230, partial [Lucifuga dentata]